MLTGIKKGKRKRKEKGAVDVQPSQSTTGPTSSSSSSSNQNRAAADELRRLLSAKSGVAVESTTTHSTKISSPQKSEQSYVFERLEKRGKIAAAGTTDGESNIIITNSKFSGSAPEMARGRCNFFITFDETFLNLHAKPATIPIFFDWKRILRKALGKVN